MWDYFNKLEHHADRMRFVSRVMLYIMGTLVCVFGLWFLAKFLWHFSGYLDRVIFSGPWAAMMPVPQFQQTRPGMSARLRQRLIVTVDPATGLQREIPESQIETTFARDGGIHTVERLADTYVCRHDPRRPPGGACHVCGGRACVDCFRACARCLAPCCPAHTGKFEDATHGAAFYCPRCYGQLSRQRLAIRAVSICLWPFVRFGEEKR